MIKVAASSNDGKTVNEHFGKAEAFYVYKLVDNGLNFIEKREVESYCASASSKELLPEHEFNNDRFNKVYATLKDCQVVYTQQIGLTPLTNLKNKGIDIQICNCTIHSIGGCGGNCSH